MDDEVFCHGSTGQWMVTICYLQEADDGGAATAEIRFLGELHCRLSLSQPMTSRDALVEKLRLRCAEWIEHAEAKTSALPADEASARLTMASWRRG